MTHSLLPMLVAVVAISCTGSKNERAATSDATVECNADSLTAFQYDTAGDCFEAKQQIEACIVGEASLGSSPLCVFSSDGSFYAASLSNGQRVSRPGWHFRFANAPQTLTFDGTLFSPDQEARCASIRNPNLGCPRCSGADQSCVPAP